MSIWVMRRPQPGAAEMAAALGVPHVVAQVLCNRRIQLEQARTYLNGTLEDLGDPLRISDMAEGVRIIREEIARGGHIRAVTDYDNDGIQCAAVALRAMRALGAHIDYDLPERDEGYGLSGVMVDRAIRDGVTLLVTMDNGISANDTVLRARKAGMRVVVTDHHELPRGLEGEVFELPNANAVIDPRRDDPNDPGAHLCGAGVVFTLLRALYASMGREESGLYPLLPLVAMATVTDVMELTGENRILVREGLKRIQESGIPGLEALIQVTGMGERTLTAYHLGFVLGPCMNAAGRLRSARLGVELMLAEDHDEAARIAAELRELNEERKTLTLQGLNTALNKVESGGMRDDRVLVVHHADLPDSVAGIVAGKLRDRYERPAIVLTGEGEELRGSGRSSHVYDLYGALSTHRELFISMGGHRMAAGMSILAENLPALRRFLNAECTLSLDDMQDRVRVDMMASPDSLTLEDAEAIARMEPFGAGFPCPLLAVKDARVDHLSVVGQAGNVVRMRVWGVRRYMWAVWFRGVDAVRAAMEARGGQGAFDRALAGGEAYLSLAYFATVNSYNGTNNIQMNIQYIQ